MKKFTKKELENIVLCCKKAIRDKQPTIEVAPEDLLGIVQNLNVERFRLNNLNLKYSQMKNPKKPKD
jgi:hypothetical protein|nr:MAG TPA: hypothetical protein [Herelleviridae sp.]